MGNAFRGAAFLRRDHCMAQSADPSAGDEQDVVDARAGRTASVVAAAPRGDGGACHRPGAPGPDRRPHRLQHGGRGVLALRRARRRSDGAVRHRGPQPRGGPSDHDAAGRGTCRPDRLQRRAAGAVRRAASSRLFLQTRDGRRNLPVVPRRAGVARRRHDRGAGGAKPRAARLFGGRARGAADDRHAARRDDRVRRTAGDSRSGRADRRAPANVAQGRRHRRWARARACGDAPAARDGVHDRRRRCGIGAHSARDGDQRHARLGRQSDRPQR